MSYTDEMLNDGECYPFSYIINYFLDFCNKHPQLTTESAIYHCTVKFGLSDVGSMDLRSLPR